MTISGRQKKNGAPASLKELITDSHILLTGTTGFIGSTLLQRILSIDPGPAKVYVLIRNRGNKDAQQRLKELLSSPLFMTLPPERLERVQAIVAQCGMKDLGMSAEDRQLLMSKCDLVFHSAGLVSFGATYEHIIRINVMGTKSVLDLVRNMPKIKAMIHVSTAYIQADKSESGGITEEKIYHCPLDSTECLELLDQLSPNEFDQQMKSILKNKYGNTYTVSKMMAECILEKEWANLPIAIVRPSLVFNTLKDPFPGWVNNMNNGVLGLIVGISYGLFRSYSTPKYKPLDIIPVDMLVSTILTAALSVAQDSSELKVYNCISSSTTPVNLSDIISYAEKAGRNNPFENMLLYPCASCYGSFYRHLIRLFIFQILPACVIVILARLFKIKHADRILEYQWRYLKGGAYAYNIYKFTWIFERKNADKLFETLPLEEQEKHWMDPKLIDWEKYIEICVIGGREHLNDVSDPTPKAVRKLKLLRILWLTAPLTGLVIIWLLLVFLGCTSSVSFFISVCVIAFLMWL